MINVHQWYITSKVWFLHLSRVLSNCFSENAKPGKRIMYCVGKILEVILHLKIFFIVVKSSVGSYLGCSLVTMQPKKKQNCPKGSLTPVPDPYLEL